MAEQIDQNAVDAIRAFLASYLKPDELVDVMALIGAERATAHTVALAHGRQACRALFALLRALADAAGGDARFMLGYEPRLALAAGTFQHNELEWWQELMNFLYVETFDDRIPTFEQALQFIDQFEDYVENFPRLLRPRIDVWLRKSEHTIGFQHRATAE